MATLEDKILGEKSEYYCSSSSEGEDDDEESENKVAAETTTMAGGSAEISKWSGTASNTGPKGVITDWQKFKQLERQKLEDDKSERLDLIKKLSITCQSALDEEKAKAEAEKNVMDPDLKDLLSDKFLQEYMQKRMNEMLSQATGMPKFGKVLNLTTGQEFLDAVDKENKSVTIVVHIYEDLVAGCDAMNGCLIHLSQKYNEVKFCKMKGSMAGLSQHFKVSGVPALLVYKGGQLVGNFVRLTDEFGDDFFSCDVEGFLVEHGMIPDKTCVPQISQQGGEDDDDSDLSLE